MWSCSCRCGWVFLHARKDSSTVHNSMEHATNTHVHSTLWHAAICDMHSICDVHSLPDVWCHLFLPQEWPPELEAALHSSRLPTADLVSRFLTQQDVAAVGGMDV